jgi:hypothetical protein
MRDPGLAIERGMWGRWRGNGVVSPRVLAQLDARSDALLGNVAGITGMVQPFPVTSAACVALGYPAPSALWTCDDVADQTDKVAGVVAALTAAALTQRSLTGVAYGANFWSKLAVETEGQTVPNGRFLVADKTKLNVGAGVDFTLSAFVRTRTAFSGSGGYSWILDKRTAGGLGYALIMVNGALQLRIQDGGGLTDIALGVTLPFDGGGHLIKVAVDRDGNISTKLDAEAPVVVVAARPGDLTQNSSGFCIGNVYSGGYTFPGQIAWVYVCIGTAADDTGHTAMWRHARAAGLSGTPSTYVRANPLRVAGAANLVFGHGAGQVPFGYDVAFATTDGDALQTGLVYEDGRNFLGLNSAAMPAWVGTNATVAAADGPDGMRGAARVADASGAAAGYASSGAATLAGATNVPHTFGARVKAVAAGGLNAILTAYFAGDAGGAEELTVATLAGTVPAAFAQFTGTVTPTRAGHTSVVLRCYPTDGVAASTGTVDFAEAWGWVGAFVPLGHRACAAGAAQATSTPVHTIVNTGNADYKPARGRVRLRIADAQNTDGATFLSCGLAGAKGALVLDRAVGGNLRLRVWDNTPALVGGAAVNCGALDGAQHILDVAWNAAAGKLSVKEGATVLGAYAGAAWVPSAVDVTPIYVGSNNGANAARASICREEWFDK